MEKIEAKIDDHSNRLVKIETKHESLVETVEKYNLSNNFQFNQIQMKLDSFSNEISSLKITMAKYLGITTGVIFVLELAMKFFVK